jgi:ribosomal protein L9
MKNILYKIIIPALIVILFVVFLLTSENDVIVVVLASALMLLLFNAYIHFMFYRDKNKLLEELTASLEETEETVRQKTVAEELVVDELPMGIIVFDDLLKIKWANKYAKGFIFQNTLENKNLETISGELFKFLGKKTDKFITKIYTYEYEVEVDYKNNIIYLLEVTEREESKRKYDAQTDVVAVLNLDNLSDAVSVLDVSERSYIQGKYLAALEDWAEEFHFYLMPISTSRLVAIMNKENLQELIKNEFKILKTIAAISKENDLLVTLSSGIACSNIKLNKLGAIAEDALDLALSRGGDQIVVNIEGNDLMYFGGNTNTAEKRTRITTRINMQKLENLFESTNRVYIAPHKYPDTDAFGAAMGILKMAHAFNKEAYIILDQGKLDKSVSKIIQLIEYEYVTFLDYFISVNQALDQMNREDLIVFVDHHSFGQSMDERLALRTKNIVIIDHHRKLSDAIEYSLIHHVEPYASSSVELVTEMIDLCSRDVNLNQFEATVMLSGIMVDTNNFMYRTGSRTFEAAAILRKFGADTFKVKNILREGLEEIQLRAQLLSLAEVVHKKFSIVIIPKGIDVTRTLLARVADLLLEIEDTVAAFAIGYLNDDEVGISARSLEGFNVQVIMEKFNGGGHLNNAGAQVKTEDIKKVRVELIHILNDAVMEEKPMKVILIKDLRGKGKKGEVIDVATGYGNFLLSNKTAIEATSENLQSIETEKARKKEKERKLVEEMKELKGKIEALPVKVFVKIGDNGKLFGKISTKQVAEEFKKQHGIEIDKRKIQLTDEINSLGNHKVSVKLHKDVNAEIEVLVLEG